MSMLHGEDRISEWGEHVKHHRAQLNRTYVAQSGTFYICPEGTIRSRQRKVFKNHLGFREPKCMSCRYNLNLVSTGLSAFKTRLFQLILVFLMTRSCLITTTFSPDSFNAFFS